MSLAKKCDRCGRFIDFGETLSGSITRSVVGGSCHYYPDEYDICKECASKLKAVILSWWKEREK